MNVGRAAIGLMGQRDRISRPVPAIGAAHGWPEAVTLSCHLPQEGCEKGTRHPSRAMRGVLYGSKFVRSRWKLRLRDERVVVHSLTRGKLDGSGQQRLWVLRRLANGLQLHEGLWRCLPSEVGHGRSL